jgi:hypothetical protein
MAASGCQELNFAVRVKVEGSSQGSNTLGQAWSAFH